MKGPLKFKPLVIPYNALKRTNRTQMTQKHVNNVYTTWSSMNLF